MAENKVQITIEVDGVKKVVNSVEDAQKAMQGLSNSTKDATESGTALGMLKGKFSGIIGPLKGVVAGMKTLKGAIISTGIGALVVILGSLASYFTTNEEGSRKLAVAMEALGIITGKVTDFFASLGEKIVWAFTNPGEAITNFKNAIQENITNRITSLIDTFGFLGSAIKKVFEGDFSGALDEAKNAGSSFVDSLTGVKDTINKVGDAAVETFNTIAAEVNVAVEAATKLVDTMRAVRDQQQALIVENANLNKELETQKKIAEDTTLAYDERKAALERVGEQQVKLAENLAKQARLEESLIKQQIAQEGNYEKREELETQLAEATAARIESETALEVEKQDAQKITRELELEEVERKRSINDMIAELNAEAIENLWEKSYEELRIQEEQALRELELQRATEEQKQKVRDLFQGKRNKLTEEEKKFNAKINKDEKDAQIAMAGQTFGAIAGLLGENSAAGKAAAIAAATINTYQGITAELATKTVTPFEIGLKIANVATIAGIGFKSVKDIISTPTPGGGGGGGGAPSLSIPSAPSVNPLDALNAGAAGDDDVVTEVGLGQQTGSASANVVRAYVVSDEMTTQQEADAKINDLARL